jgi:hypothetical protein
MRLVKLTIVLLLFAYVAIAQDSVMVANQTFYLVHGRLVKSKAAHFDVNRTYGVVSIPQSLPVVSITTAPAQVYSYQQGKLPVFCAIEDRIWRRTGLDMRFRITERPMGSK